MGKEYILKCEECGKEFSVVPYRKDRAIFCSRECYALARTGTLRPEVGPAISLATKGRIFTEEHKKKLSKIKKNLYNEGKLKINVEGLKKGQGWNKGRKGIDHVSEETKEKIRKISLERKSHLPLLKYIKENGTSWNKGVSPSEETRKRLSKSHKGIQALDKHPNWQGGKSFEPYTISFNRAFKEAIRIRDGFTCIKCGIKQEDSLILLKVKLAVHHIDYDKKNTIKENCCALCRRCNIEVNSNRSSWTKFFQSLLSERYGYQYENNIPIVKFEIQEEIKK